MQLVYHLPPPPAMPESVVRSIPALRDWDTLLRKWMGDVRAILGTPVTLSVAWSDITGAPDFAPVDHTHTTDDISGCWSLQRWINTDTSRCHTLRLLGSDDQIHIDIDRVGG